MSGDAMDMTAEPCRTVYCYGDSNTWGYDAASLFGERYPKAVRWTGIIEGSGMNVINDGVNGRCIPQEAYQISLLAESLTKALEDEGALALWIMLGTNDLLNDPAGGAKSAAVRMDRFLAKLMEFPVMQKDIAVRLISPPLIRRGSWVETDELVRQSQLLGKAMEAVAKRREVDFTDAGGFDIPLLYDGVHFTEEGHRAFASGMMKICGRL